jgi:4-deoxy-L-threo-5-hexosulose-uronate ketol-isomerase
MTTRELRANFLLEDLFRTGELQLVYWETDRTVIGSAVPAGTTLRLEAGKELAAEYFCERREIGVINLGQGGVINVDGTNYELNRLDCLYIGRGSREIGFRSHDPLNPAKFYLVSHPAHTTYSTTLATQQDARQLHLGSQETANKRTIYQCIYEKGLQSCQLVMGYTQLDPGSVWNTMPAHTHARRSEVYLYFDIAEDTAVFHFMGPGDGTRNLMMHSEQVVLSPIWSIHAGCGTRAYSFVWAMGGENQRFDDMDAIAIRDLR